MEIRAMTLTEYEKYLGYLNECYEKVNNKEIQTYEMGMLVMKWVAKEIYGIDPYTLRPGTLKHLSDKTIELTEKSEIEDEKNSVTSGIGE